MPARPPGYPASPVRGEPATPTEAVVNKAEFPADGDGVVGRVHEQRSWDAVKRHCPWPPGVAAWEILDDACLSAMFDMRLDADEWRRVLDDPGGTRRAVVAALDDPQCHLRRGESRPDLREACAADAMVRLAELQQKCLETAHTDWRGVFDRRFRAETQEEYHHGAERDAENLAYALWKTYVCRADMDALAWIEALPEPQDDVAYAGREIFVPSEERGRLGGFRPPRLTQVLPLYALALRLGADVPEWVNEDSLASAAEAFGEGAP